MVEVKIRPEEQKPDLELDRQKEVAELSRYVVPELETRNEPNGLVELVYGPELSRDHLDFGSVIVSYADDLNPGPSLGPSSEANR